MKEESELTFGETIKQPFPELEDVESISLNIPQYYSDLDGEIPSRITFHTFINDTYNILKKAYKNGENVTWQLKQTDPHADIKAKYEKAIADGKIVKMFVTDMQNNYPYETKEPSWHKTSKYQLRCYNIDWNKLLSESYANGEFVECEFSDFDDGFKDAGAFHLMGVSEKEFIAIDDTGYSIEYQYCRLAKGVEIKDEWLKEVK